MAKQDGNNMDVQAMMEVYKKAAIQALPLSSWRAWKGHGPPNEVMDRTYS